MFVSLPEFRFPLPSALAPPGAQYWRTLTTSTNTAWYILKVKVADSDGELELRTLLFWWDRDVVDAIDQLRPTSIESLVCVLPEQFGGRRGRRHGAPCIVLKEIWQAHDPSEPQALTPLFVDEHGLYRTGLLAEATADPPAKVRLVGRVSACRSESTAKLQP